ncbi:hypothetical protein GCM10028794_24260 [Silanimonas algicola]
MSIELNGDRSDVWRLFRVFSVSVLAAAVIGCHTDAESETPPPSRWWYVEDAPPSDGMAYRTAMLTALEGWNGEGSNATSLTVFNQLYENGGLVVQIGMTGKASRPRCPMQGCYLYARRPGGNWQTLRAVPTDDSRNYLDVLNPWSLLWLFDGAEDLEIEVPVQPTGTCVYTLPAAGYRWDLHQPRGEASLNGDGTRRERVSLTEEDEQELDGPPSDDTPWPRCTALSS